MPAFHSYHLSKSRVSALSTTPFHICASEVLGMFFHVGPKKEKRKERKRGRNKKQPKNALQKRVPEFSTSTTTSCTIGHPLYYEQALRMLPLLRKEHPAKNTLDRLPAMLDGGERTQAFSSRFAQVGEEAADRLVSLEAEGLGGEIEPFLLSWKKKKRLVNTWSTNNLTA